MFNCSKCNLIGPTVNLKRIRPIYCLFFHDKKKCIHPPPVFLTNRTLDTGAMHAKLETLGGTQPAKTTQ